MSFHSYIRRQCWMTFWWFDSTLCCWYFHTWMLVISIIHFLVCYQSNGIRPSSFTSVQLKMIRCTLLSQYQLHCTITLTIENLTVISHRRLAIGKKENVNWKFGNVFYCVCGLGWWGWHTSGSMTNRLIRYSDCQFHNPHTDGWQRRSRRKYAVAALSPTLCRETVSNLSSDKN